MTWPDPARDSMYQPLSNESRPSSVRIRRVGGLDPPEARSRPLYHSDGLAGHNGNWVDGTARRRTEADLQDETRHLAKVRVAGSNPVFRSKNSGPELGKLKIEPVIGARDTAHHCPSLPITSPSRVDPGRLPLWTRLALPIAGGSCFPGSPITLPIIARHEF